MKGVRYMFKKLFRARDPWYGPDSPNKGMIYPLLLGATMAVMVFFFFFAEDEEIKHRGHELLHHH